MAGAVARRDAFFGFGSRLKSRRALNVGRGSNCKIDSSALS